LKNIRIKLNNIQSKYSLYKKIEIKHYYNIIIMWARPAQFAGPDSAQKGWADLDLIVISVFFVWVGPGPDIMVGPELAWPKKETKRGGELFSPSHPPACRTNIVLHAGETYTENEVKVEGKEELPGTEEAVPCWSGCFASTTVVEAVAVSWLTDGSSKQRCCCFKRQRERFLLFCLFLSQTHPCFKLVFFPLSLSPVYFPFLFLPFPFRFSVFFFISLFFSSSCNWC
jgi:hypothetical protein